MPSTVKITQLPSASHSDITSATSVLPIIDGDTTKQITVENLLIAAGTAISGNLIPVPNSGETTSSFSLGSEASAWKDLYISDGTIFFQKGDGTRSTFTKENIDDLKSGKSISTDSDKKLVNSVDATTYIRMGDTGKAWHYINDQPVFKMGVGLVNVGDSSTRTEIGAAGIGGGSSALIITGSSGVTIEGPTTLGTQGIIGGMIVTGSTEISGSATVSGSFTVTDLLTLLGNFGQTGSFGVTGSSTFQGDVNMDGIVTTTDLLQVVAGINISGSNEITGSLEISGSNIAGSPPALVITGSTEMSGSTSVDGPFVVNNLLDLLANFGQTGLPTGSGEGGVAVGDINLDGQVNVNDLLLLIAGMGNPNILVNNLTIPQNTNYQLVGPEITVSQSIVVTVGTNAFLNIT